MFSLLGNLTTISGLCQNLKITMHGTVPLRRFYRLRVGIVLEQVQNYVFLLLI